MKQFSFTVRGDRITRENNDDFVEGNKNSYKAVFDFGADAGWEPLAKLCVVVCGTEVYRIPILGGECTLPTFSRGTFSIGAMGVDMVDEENSTVISTNMIRCEASTGAVSKEANAELNTAAEVWEIYLAQMEECRAEAKEAATEAKESADSITELTVGAETIPEGSEAEIEKSVTEDGIHLTFKIPKGEQGLQGVQGEQGPQGIQGEQGKDGYTPQKGVDYFTQEDIDTLGIPALDARVSEHEERITANDTNITEIGQTQKESLDYFGNEIDRLTTTTQDHDERITANANDIGILANRMDNIEIEMESVDETYVKKDYYITDFESVLGRLDNLEQSVEILAGLTDEETTPFATKTEVDTKIQEYIDEAILGGAW